MKPQTHFIITHEKMAPLHHLSIWLGSEEGLKVQKGATIKTVPIPEKFLSEIQGHAEGIKGDRSLFGRIIYLIKPHPEGGKVATDVSYQPKGALFDFQPAPRGVRIMPGLGRHIEDVCLGILETEAGVTHIVPTTPTTPARKAQLKSMELPTGEEPRQAIPISKWRERLRK